MTPAEAAAARPRVEGEREHEILEAALDVLADVGYDRLTMDAVASAARASKATLYRRWDTKASLVLEAVLAQKGPLAAVPDTGSLRGDLLASHCGRGGLTDERQIAIFSAVLTALGRDTEFADGFRTRILGPKVEATQELFARARERGEVRDDVDLDIVGPALAGIVLHREFVLGEVPTPERVAAVIDQVILPAVLRHSPDQTPKDPS
ncbi:AcrR family transcriptional regulator [Aeromicrobium sp. SORGH_AS981]|uniref:TetR/AcrR family transcriptional regulator n=1 Tax=Aeromicrobium sp. SORGH_AS_0981 TaxID=3041802 RepID=UPI00285793E3|nr:TetR/AcrR family transcriptional regulator [Aeromicrobium sp. SORGH_AS_0981]MDR6116964.1 AcrR family transcriptional regulator [Aeromicrobium sp. SORGH_AS_0981]